MKLSAAIFLGACLASCSAALAADQPQPSLVAIFNWAGFYVGGYAGYALGGARATDAGDNQIPPVGWYQLGGKFSTNTHGFNGGVQTGYNWQFGGLVTGVEADFGYLGARGRKVWMDPSGFNDTYVDSTNGLAATLRGRLGLTVDKALIYATAGGISANVGASVLGLGNGLVSNKTGIQTGWTVGAGIEYAVAAEWSAKVEYLYFDLGSKTVAFPQQSKFDIRSTGNLLRFGVNYHF